MLPTPTPIFAPSLTFLLSTVSQKEQQQQNIPSSEAGQDMTRASQRALGKPDFV